jgi:transcriptional regulator with XRE-family HTH domain
MTSKGGRPEKPNEIRERVSSNLIWCRAAFGYKQRTIAKYVGVNRATVGYWETGHTLPCYENLIKVSDFLEIPIDALLKRDLKEEFKRWTREEFRFDGVVGPVDLEKV